MKGGVAKFEQMVVRTEATAGGRRKICRPVGTTDGTNRFSDDYGHFFSDALLGTMLCAILKKAIYDAPPEERNRHLFLRGKFGGVAREHAEDRAGQFLGSIHRMQPFPGWLRVVRFPG